MAHHWEDVVIAQPSLHIVGFLFGTWLPDDRKNR